MKHVLKLFSGSIILFFAFSCAHKQNQEAITIFHAGSLSYPITEITAAYLAKNPGVAIYTEAAGSVASIRKITELGRQADLLASADHHLIDQLLIPEHADHNIRFATNSIVIAYNERSLHSGHINSHNWAETLMDTEVHIGSSDPDADPCGYRTLLCLQLEGLRTGKDNLTGLILSGKRHYLRPKETDLIALLETGTIDYMFIYESVAIQHGMRHIKLSDSVNLSNPALTDWYAQSKVMIRGTEPGSQLEIKGEPITYGITVLKNAANEKRAWDFVNFVLNPDKGGKILKASGQQPVYPAQVNDIAGIPDEIMIYIQNTNQ